MIQEFEGKTKDEAIDNAISALGLSKEEIDIEIVESKKSLLFFGKNKVKIRVHMGDEEQTKIDSIENENDHSAKIIDFIKGLLKKMGISGKIVIRGYEPSKLLIDIISPDSGILIGKKGKTLDSIQLLVNVFAGKNNYEDLKIIVDTENYRKRREKSLVTFAHKIAEQVKRSKGSMLLEAMNPFERRLIHTALNENPNIETISEGDGLYKRVRILYKGNALG